MVELSKSKLKRAEIYMERSAILSKMTLEKSAIH
jgi:hypothetical protein